ncbi:phosphoribosylanthranilate isomerase [Bradyrhizobium japonicum]
MSLLVKICGLSTGETLETALDAGADMVGFVFFPPSPRHVSLELGRDLGRQVKRRALKVALTVDADDATLDNIMDALSPDILQLHGKESVARLRDIKQRFGRPVMKAVPVATAADLAVLPGYAEVARSHPVRRAGAKGRDTSRRPRRGLRLAPARKPGTQAAVYGLGRT